MAAQEFEYDARVAKADSLIEQINKDHKQKVKNLREQIQVFKTKFENE